MNEKVFLFFNCQKKLSMTLFNFFTLESLNLLTLNLFVIIDCILCTYHKLVDNFLKSSNALWYSINFLKQNLLGMFENFKNFTDIADALLFDRKEILNHQYIENQNSSRTAKNIGTIANK